MATVEEVGRDLLGSIATDAGLLLAAKWIDNRYKELVSRVRFRHLRKIGELQMPAVVDAGTVAITRDATSVTGTDTTWATSPGVATHTQWFLRASSAWYRIAEVTSDTALTLATAFSENTVTAASYKIVKRYHSLASGARWLGAFVHDRLLLPLDVRSLTELDMIAPGRAFVGTYPRIVAQRGVDASNYLEAEIYPPSSNSELIRYVYWDLPTALTISSTIPAQVDGYVLKEGALIDAYRFEAAKSVRDGNVEAAAYWRNESRAQMTSWEKRIQEATRADRGVDDVSLILQLPRRYTSEGYEQRTARDIVAERVWE